jgi:hypothetical protein
MKQLFYALVLLLSLVLNWAFYERVYGEANATMPVALPARAPLSCPDQVRRLKEEVAQCHEDISRIYRELNGGG